MQGDSPADGQTKPSHAGQHDTTETHDEPWHVLRVQHMDKQTPDIVLPKRVTLEVMTVRVGLDVWVHGWCARADDGQRVIAPATPGDSDEDREQFVAWLERHGYRLTDAGDSVYAQD